MNVKAEIAKELHRAARRNYPTRRVELKGIDDHYYQADLVEMIPYSRMNNNYKYILMLINCFTKFAFAIPLKRKTGDEVASALAPLLKRHRIKLLQTDAGKEFYNSKVEALLKEHNVKLYSTYSEKKASIVERLNRTIKTRMWTKFSEQGSYKWLHLLPTLVHEYNNTVHRTIGMKPKDVNKTNEELVMRRINSSVQRPANTRRPKFKVDDPVRISKNKKIFDKSYIQNWSNEIFKIHAVHNESRPVTYELIDTRGEIIKGRFYEHELTKTDFADVYLVERVIRRKNGKVLVKWMGFDKSFNSWVDEEDLVLK
jgi:hypothetical protein